MTVARSRSISLRRSPKPGALTATTFRMPRSLLTTSVASASASTSSAMISRSLWPVWTRFSSTGRSSVVPLIFLVGDQHVRLVQRCLHPLHVAHEVGRDVAAVELHALGVLDLDLQAFALFDGDHAVMADLVHGLGEQLADLRVVGRDRGDVLDVLFAFDGNRQLARSARPPPAAPRSMPRLSSIGLAPAARLRRPFGDHRLGQHRGGGGPVAGHIVGSGGGLLEHLGAHVREVILELDLFGHGHAIMRDGRCAPFLIDGHVAAARAHGHLDRVGQSVDTGLELSTRVGVVDELLCRHVGAPTSFRLSARDDGQQVTFADHEIVLAFQLDLGARVSREQHRVTGLDLHRDAIAVVQHPAIADRQHRAFLGFLARRVRQDDAAGGHCVFRLGCDDHAVAEWRETDCHECGVLSFKAACCVMREHPRGRTMAPARLVGQVVKRAGANRKRHSRRSLA